MGGCSYTGNGGGAILTEMPMAICAEDATVSAGTAHAPSNSASADSFNSFMIVVPLLSLLGVKPSALRF
jgi:hypothetical protein